MMQILKNVFAISIEVYTDFRSSNKLTIRFAAVCCFVFNMFTSLLVKENKATSAPETTKLNSNKASKTMIKNVVPCGVTASKV